MAHPMPLWLEFLRCPNCCQLFDDIYNKPISLACAHTLCQPCLIGLIDKRCPYDLIEFKVELTRLPVNDTILRLLGFQPTQRPPINIGTEDENQGYNVCKQVLENFAWTLTQAHATTGEVYLSCNVQQKLLKLISCQLLEPFGRREALRMCRNLGEQLVAELIISHYKPVEVNLNFWFALKLEGCLYLGPVLQDRVLKEVVHFLGDGSKARWRDVITFVTKKIQKDCPLVSESNIGSVMDLLNIARCFRVKQPHHKPNCIIQLKKVFRTYYGLRRRHDSKIIAICSRYGIRIPIQYFSYLLYGDLNHQPLLMSIIDEIQSPEWFPKAVWRLTIALETSGDPTNLFLLRPSMEALIAVNPDHVEPAEMWQLLKQSFVSVKNVVHGVLNFIKLNGRYILNHPQVKHNTPHTGVWCRCILRKSLCPRGISCFFIHSKEELERFQVEALMIQHGVKNSDVVTTEIPVGFPMGFPSKIKNDQDNIIDMINIPAVTRDQNSLSFFSKCNPKPRVSDEIPGVAGDNGNNLCQWLVPKQKKKKGKKVKIAERQRDTAETEAPQTTEQPLPWQGPIRQFNLWSKSFETF